MCINSSISIHLIFFTVNSPVYSHQSHASCDFKSKQVQRTWMAANNVNRNSHANCTPALLYLEVEVKSVFGEANLLQPRRKQKNNWHMGRSVCRGNPRCSFTIHWVHNNIGSKVLLLPDLGLLGRVVLKPDSPVNSLVVWPYKNVCLYNWVVVQKGNKSGHGKISMMEPCG